MEDKIGQLDRLDRKILAELAQDARISMTELAQRVGLSKSPTLTRVKRLERAGVIRGYRAVLDQAQLGQAQICFVQVTLDNTRTEALEAFNDAVRRAPVIEAAHMIAGGFDYLLKIRSKDIAAYRRTLGEVISDLPHVAHTSTFTTMETVKEW